MLTTTSRGAYGTGDNHGQSPFGGRAETDGARRVRCLNC
jgi:hypothetical protein